MKKTLVTLAIILLSCAWSKTMAQDWQMKQARIMSPWSENIDPNNVLNEYPRPQLVRENWYNLNGIWDFAQVSEMKYDKNQSFHEKILVPFA